MSNTNGYIKGNKSAWEEAFKNKMPGWGEGNHIRLKSERLAFFNDDMKKQLEGIDFKGKTVAQFCCNNGRELLSLMDCGARAGVGFDIAENIIGQAKEMALKANIQNCDFVACNILEIPESYHNQFDFIFFTIGAITWFEDLTQLFGKVSQCLKEDGLFLINDFHPIINMLPLPGEEGFDQDNLNQLMFSYFRKEPWIEDNAAGYITEQRGTKTFISFSHTMSAIINALSVNGIKTAKLNEYDYDIGMTEVYNGKGFPLSFILIGEKSREHSRSRL